MYVADFYEIEALRDLEAEIQELLDSDPDCEQCKWDMEDVQDRIRYIRFHKV